MRDFFHQITPVSFFLLVVCALLVLLFNVMLSGANQHFTLLSQSFLNGKLYFPDGHIPFNDIIPFKNHDFWPSGPFPAVLLMPLVIFARIIPSIAPQAI